MKLIDHIKSRLINTVAGVTVHYTKSDEFTISYVLLKLEKGKIVIDSSANKVDSFAELQNHFDKNTPVWISITGRSVISRKLDKNPDGKYLNHILPNAKESDFSISLVENEKDEVFVSALRNEIMEAITTDIHDSGYNIIGCSIGVASIAILFQYGLIKEKTLNIPGYQIKGMDKELADVLSVDEYSEENYIIAGESISSGLILPFSLAFSYLTNQTGFDIVSGDTIYSDEESYFYSRINRYFALGSLAFLFLILLINFLIFNSKHSKNQSLSDKLAYHETFFVQRDSLRSELLNKTKLINQVGLKYNTRYGYFADRIVAVIPKGIVLNELSINPIEDKVKANKPLHFSSIIRVKGTSRGSILINDWINELEKYEWIKDIEIIDYEKTGSTGNLEIQILY